MADNLEMLQAFQPTWSECRERYQRSLVTIGDKQVCGDPRLEYTWRTMQHQMDSFLEGYHAQLFSTEVAVPESVEVEVFASREAQVDGRGTE